MTKVCSKCGMDKTYSEFYKMSASRDGVTPWCKVCRCVYDKQRYDANVGNILRQKADYYTSRMEEIKVSQKLYRDGHKQEHIARNNSRRARELNQFVESVSRSLVWKRDNGVCYICNLPADSKDWHLEHKIPLSKGGLHSYDNTAVSHPKCNLTKGSKLLVD